MYMAINKARHDIGQTGVNRFAIGFYAFNMAIFYPKGGPIDMPIRDVY
jgi:hypothetical protein